MIYLNEISIVKQYRSLPVGMTIPLTDLVILVGKQGAGKSSILNLLSKNDTEFLEYSLIDDVKKVSSFYFDSESMNPRIREGHHYTDINGNDVGFGVANALLSRWQSHGEVLKKFTVDKVAEAENCVLLLDEPESALCLENQYKLAKQLKLSAKKNQVILSTHSLILIQSVLQVYDVTTKKWMSSKMYIESELKAAKRNK